MKTTRKKDKAKHSVGKKLISSLIVLALLAIALLIYRDSLEEILRGIREVSFSAILVSALFSLLYFLLEGTIIYRMAAMYAPEYRLSYGIDTAYRCEFYRLITFGSGAGLAEIHCLYRNGIERASAAGISILQFVIKKVSVALLGILGFLVLLASPQTRELCGDYLVFLAAGIVITLAIVLALLAVILSDAVMKAVLWLLDRITARFPSAGAKTASIKEQVQLLNRSGRELFARKGALLQNVLLNLVKFIAAYAVPAYLLYGKCALPPRECIALMAVVYMLAGVIPAPSGIGSLEFVYLLFFGGFAEPEVAVPSLLVFRFVTWILPFAVGGILCLYDRITRGRRSANYEDEIIEN